MNKTNGSAKFCTTIRARQRRDRKKQESSFIEGRLKKRFPKILGNLLERQRQHGFTAPGRPKTLPQNFGEVSEQGRARDLAASKVGSRPAIVSLKQFRSTVVENFPPRSEQGKARDLAASKVGFRPNEKGPGF